MKKLDQTRLCFFAERQVGIGSAAAAIEPHVRQHAGVTWVDVTYRKEHGRIERLPLPGRVGGTLRGYLQTRAGLNTGPFDALFFLTHNPAVLQPRAVRRTPTVLWTDVTPKLLDGLAAQYDQSADSFGPVRAFKHALVRQAYQRAAFCVGWSEWARRSFVEDYGVPEEQTRVIPPGVDLDRFAPGDRALPQGLPHLLFVGGDFARKGGDLLLDVFRSRLRGRCVLDLVTRDAVPEEEGVRVHRGLQADSPELLALYGAASVFVLPTRGDCFSIASIEAMAMRLPVVVSGLGGIPDIVEPGSSGHLIASGDGGALAAALETMLESPELRERMGARGRSIVEQRFDARKSATLLIDLMRSIAGGRQQSAGDSHKAKPTTS